MKLPILICLFAQIFNSIAYSQSIVNTEKLQMNDSSKIGIIIEPFIDFQSGNTDVLEFSNSTNFFLSLNKTNRIIILSGNDVLLNESGTIINDHFGQLRHTYLFAPRLNTFVFGQIQKSNNLILDQRILFGAGIRYKLINKNQSNFSFSLASGAMYEKEVLDDSKMQNTDLYQNKPETSVLRLSNFAVLVIIISDDIYFTNTTYYQPIVFSFSDFRVLSDMDLVFKFNKWLGFNLNLIYRFDSKPPDILSKTDYFINGGMTISLIK